MDFNGKEYSCKDFRKEENLFTQFNYSEVNSGPGITWCTEYYYLHLPNGKYRFVMIDSFDEELYYHREYETAEEFAEDLKEATNLDLDEEQYLNEEILSLCPEDIREEEDLGYHFNEVIADLIHVALKEGDRALVKALLPNFTEYRESLYPTPYIPNLPEKELERRRNLYREHYRSEGYVEEKPDYFVERGGHIRHTVSIGKYSICYSTISPFGGSRSSILLENTEKLPNKQ